MRKRSLSLVLSFILIFACLLSDFSAISVNAETSANSRQKAYIEFASSRSTVSEQGVQSLTKDEMRILGVFLSNFYVPWSTQLVETDDDDSSREQMVDILTDSLKFDETLAKDIVDATFQMSIDSATKLELELYYQRDDSVYSYKFSDFSYYDLLCYLSGSDVSEIYFKDGSEVVTYPVIGAYLTCNGNIVFDLDYNSPSNIALRQCLRNLPMNKGIGYNLISVPKDLEGASYTGDNFDTILGTVSTVDDLYHISIFGWSLYVDCFGNIIVDCGTGRQYVLLPACMNPYVWKKDGCNVGECLPMNNLAWFSESACGSLSFGDFAKRFNPIRGGFDGSSEEEPAISFNFDKRGTSDNVNKSLNKICIVRGSSESGLSDLGDRWSALWGGSSGSATESVLGIYSVYNSYDHLYKFTSETDDVLFKIYDALPWTSERLDYVGMSLSRISTGGRIAESQTIQDFIMFDTLGAFSSENETSMCINQYGIFADSEHTPLGGDISDKFRNYLYDSKNNTLVKMTAEEQKKYIAGIYCAYVFAYFETQGTDAGGHVNFRFCADNLPEIGSGTIELTDNSLSEMQSQVLSMAYLLMHPTEGTSYVKKLVKTKVGGVLLDWHSDLVGNTNTGSTTGSTKYAGASGYMTTPEISDVSWLNSLFCLYTKYIAYVLLFVLVIMIIYAISGYLSWQRAVINAVCFGASIYILPMLISSCISFANNTTDSFYNNKFTYWGIVQHQAYEEDLNSAIEADNYADYMVTLFNQQGFEYDSHAVNLKWMCPKKDNYLVNIERELTESTNSSSITKLLRGVLNSQISGEDYTRSADRTYLYRSYTDIASYAKYVYENIGGRGTGKQVNDLGRSGLEYILGYDDVSLLSYFNGYSFANGAVKSNVTDTMLDFSQTNGFSYNTGIDELGNNRFYYFNRSYSVARALMENLRVVSSNYDAFGVPTSSFNFTVANFNSSMSVPAEQISLGVFALYSESPFYYLNWNLRDQLRISVSSSSYPIKDLLLQRSDDGVNSYFYNTSSQVEGTDAYGQMRDYMDMRSLFTIVIPYLKECNDFVIEFDEIYGLKMIGDYEVKYITNEDGTMTLDVPYGLSVLTDDNKDAYYSYWHDVQVSNLFNIYTPWVDTLYACSYAKPEKVTVAGKTYVIEDPLNPASYPEERPMVFSESERLYYGLTYADLTKVEKKILNVNESCYEVLPAIMNYYTFDRDVLITAISMMETFEFNKEFSETPFIGESNVLYPQGFELKNFSFDAYFRLVLSETTGIDLNSSKSIYETVVEDTSIFTAILILVVDVTAVWIIPFLRIAIIVLLFLMSIVVVLHSCVAGKQGDSLDFRSVISNIGKSVVSPLVKYTLITVICAWVVSLFLSSGYTGITGKLDYTISFGDPIFAIFALLLVNAILIVMYCKIGWSMIKDLKKQSKGIGASIMAVGAGLTALCTGAIASKSANAVMGDMPVAGNGTSTSDAKSPKLKPNNRAQERLARKELADRRNEKIKNGANTVKDAVTSPFKKYKANKNAKLQAENERVQAEQAQAAEEKAKVEAQARKDSDMKKQADLNAKALLDEQERRESARKAKETAEKQAQQQRNREIRENNIQKGMQEVKRRQEAKPQQSANKPKNNKGSKTKPKANSQKPKKKSKK